MRYPGGRKVLKPWMRIGFPWNNIETRSITPGVSILVKQDQKRTKAARWGYKTKEHPDSRASLLAAPG